MAMSNFAACRSVARQNNGGWHCGQLLCPKRHDSFRYTKNHNHQLNWWYAPALKWPRTCNRLKTRRIDCQPHLYSQVAPKGAFLLPAYSFVLVVRERVSGRTGVCPAASETLKTGIAEHTPFTSDWKIVGSAESQTLKTGIAGHTPFTSDWKNVGSAES